MFFTGTVSPQRYEYICKRYGFKTDGSQDNEIITKIHRLFLAESATDVNYHTARKIEKEVEKFYYEMITRRMSAEAAKESAENMLKKIENDYKLGSDQNLREWIYGGIDRINKILETIVKFKNGAQILENIAKKTKK